MTTATEIMKIAPRSIFCWLEPIAVNSADTEDFWSWIVRVAAEHRVAPGALCVREIYPRVTKTFSKFRTGCPEIGGGVNLVAALHYLKRLSGIRGLESLSRMRMLEFFPSLSLFSPVRRWCGYCMCEDAVPYHRFVWQLDAYQVCHKHSRLLQDTCPKCAKNVHYVDYSSHPTLCSCCGAFLGSPRQLIASARMTERSRDVARLVGYLHANPSVAPEVAFSQLRRCARLAGLSSSTELARFTGYSAPRASQWANGKAFMTLPTFLDICRSFGLAPDDFLRGTPPKLADRFERTTPRKVKRPWTRQDWPAIERRAEAEIEDSGGRVSLEELAQTIGVEIGNFRKKLPHLITVHNERRKRYLQRSKSDRYRQQLEDVLTAARVVSTSGQTHTWKRISQHLEHPGILRDPEFRTLARNAVAALLKTESAARAA